MVSPWGFIKNLGAEFSTADPFVNQNQNWLNACVSRNANTHVGKQFKFEQIKTVQDYQSHVPTTKYEDISPLIARVAQGETDLLFKGKAVAFEKTSGTTGGSKLIPYSNEGLLDFQKAILPWLANVAEKYQLNQGAIYWAISPATRQPQLTPGGIPIGLPDGAYLGNEILQVFYKLSAVPPWVGAIEDVAEWEVATLYHLIGRDDLIMISVWSPTFFNCLLQAIEIHQHRLHSLFVHGGNVGRMVLPNNPDAASRLTRYLDTRETRTLWPRLKLVSAWANGSSASYYRSLKASLPQAEFQPKGLLSTEGVTTVPNYQGLPTPAVNSGFYEFLDHRGNVFLADGLKEGELYEVVLTTASGLYRYRTSDLVRMTVESDIRTIQFVSRGNLHSDLVGEKLDEKFVADCLSSLDGFKMLIPDKKNARRYILVVDNHHATAKETLSNQVEKKLNQNPHYAYARKIGQLNPLSVRSIVEPLERYINFSVKNGIRLGDIKIPFLGTQNRLHELFVGDTP